MSNCTCIGCIDTSALKFTSPDGISGQLIQMSLEGVVTEETAENQANFAVQLLTVSKL